LVPKRLFGPFRMIFGAWFGKAGKPQRTNFGAGSFDSRRKVKRIGIAHDRPSKAPDQRLRPIQSIGQFTQPPRAFSRGYLSRHSNHINPPVANLAYGPS